mmetsp:Transcript_26104/g.36607  ORF Transcript_26104/g.36607 Transcript_26104/m.36607 type:complete len:97 (-) Transcript_26104:36-326(-)
MARATTTDPAAARSGEAAAAAVVVGEAEAAIRHGILTAKAVVAPEVMAEGIVEAVTGVMTVGKGRNGPTLHHHLLPMLQSSATEWHDANVAEIYTQ